MLGFVVYIKTHFSQPPRERVGLLSVDLSRTLKFKACFGLKDVTACWCGVGLSLQSSTLNKKQDIAVYHHARTEHHQREKRANEIHRER